MPPQALREILEGSDRDLRAAMELLSGDQRKRLLAALLVAEHPR